MEYYVGLDVSLKQTSICVVDQTGSVVREGVVDSNPEAISAFVRSKAPNTHDLEERAMQTLSVHDGGQRPSQSGCRMPAASRDTDVAAQRFNMGLGKKPRRSGPENAYT